MVLGTAGGLAVITLLLAVLLLRRKSWSRWGLLGTGLLTLFVADVGQSVVSGGRDWDRIAFVVQAGLVVLAVVLLFLRPSRVWLRRDRG